MNEMMMLMMVMLNHMLIYVVDNLKFHLLILIDLLNHQLLKMFLLNYSFVDQDYLVKMDQIYFQMIFLFLYQNQVNHLINIVDLMMQILLMLKIMMVIKVNQLDVLVKVLLNQNYYFEVFKLYKKMSKFL